MPTTHYALWSKDSLGNMQWNSTNVNNYATSTIHSYLNTTYYNTLPTQDKEKLGTKAVMEEFHAVTINGTLVYKQLYGWNTIHSNVWLPALSELIGHNPNAYREGSGTYLPVMQELNISPYYWTDAQGGEQFNYFKQFNQSGGGAVISNACNQQQSWTRSSVYWDDVSAWRVSDSTNMDTPPATDTLAVHPAVLYNPERPVKQNRVVLLKDV